MDEAIATLNKLGIEVGGDFFTLNHMTILDLLDEADAQGYTRPADAPASRARCFHDKLQRQARGDSV